MKLIAKYHDVSIERASIKRNLEEVDHNLDKIVVQIVCGITGLREGTVVKDGRNVVWKVTHIQVRIGNSSFFDYPALKKLNLGFKLFGRKKTTHGWHKCVTEIYREPLEILESANESSNGSVQDVSKKDW